MRSVRIILIVMVLIGFPALSWVYLNSGLKWRIKAQEETAGKVSLKDFVLSGSDSTQYTPQELSGKFMVIATPTDSLSFLHLSMVHSQFHARTDYKTMYLLPAETAVNFPGDTTWIQTRCILGCENIWKALFDTAYSAAIVDDSLYVRGRYRLTSVQEMRKLVEHLAVVLPIEKRERIQLKRGNQ